MIRPEKLMAIAMATAGGIERGSHEARRDLASDLVLRCLEKRCATEIHARRVCRAWAIAHNRRRARRFAYVARWPFDMPKPGCLLSSLLAPAMDQEPCRPGRKRMSWEAFRSRPFRASDVALRLGKTRRQAASLIRDAAARGDITNKGGGLYVVGR